MVYTALHEGQAPREMICETVYEPVGHLHPLIPGCRETRISEIQYWKVVTDGTYRYHHPFAKPARPVIVQDDAGRYFILRGRYITTYRGIEDRKAKQMQSERLPGRATQLTTLGPLDWILVEGENGETKKIEFGRKNPGPHNGVTIAHDQNGDLHVVYPSRANPARERGYSTRSKEMRHLHGARRRARRNPSRRTRKTSVAAVAMPQGQPQSVGEALSTERLKNMFTQSMMVGGGAIVGSMALNKLFSMESISNAVTNPYLKSALKIAAGVVGGLLVGYAAPTVGWLGAGLAIGGVVTGGNELITTYQTRQLTSGGTSGATPGATPGTSGATPGTSGATPGTSGTNPVQGARMVYLPAAGVTLPAEYTTYNQQTCAR